MANVEAGEVYQDYEGDWIVVFNEGVFGTFGSEERAEEFLNTLRVYSVPTTNYINHLCTLIKEYEERVLELCPEEEDLVFPHKEEKQ
jgi:hypothetical protein|tara:strand:+ start:54 stop:314 length:261 start_codon:yes stop_codon:yes gene_type:complete